ncbi:MAG: YdcH family protein [Rhodoferax sp.]|uniref:YdcH family protein n=1 Tax=Rhodoferax sp. TaxID=50421 RepID=UPI002608A6E2|nr:YdcH family protein [Rhodoferax sp.]MDD5332682.1 YdcH family protein [Rhodoferax sp.]
MFPEYSDLIARLNASNQEFMRLFEQHHALDQRVKNMETRIEPATHEQIENLKKEKLLIKDHLYVILKKHLAAKA